METSSVCANCVYGTPLVNKDVICKKKGVVSNSFSCKKHVMDLTKKNIRKKHTIATLK